ncbi:MAG: hypothetical protein ACSLFI_07730 [Solirubrobacterales bacterium]
MTEERLIGWLCIMAHQFRFGFTFDPGPEVDAELQRRGWIRCDEADWEGNQPTEITEAGRLVVDLNSPEWGLTWAYELRSDGPH